jgi:putative photosynthetic complex assembly protein 2
VVKETVMDGLALAIPYVLLLWWFSTGAVLVLVGLSARHGAASKAGTVVLFAASLAGLAASSRLTSAAAAYCVFTCAILVWGAVEIALLAGWITGPRPKPCPRDCTTAGRAWFALQAIAYHELALVATAALVFAVTAEAPNRLGGWTFAALLVLRQSAKLNLFLGVRTLNDELLPRQVEFLRSYFARRPFNVLFPLSVTLSTAAVAYLAAAAIGAESTFDGLCWTLLAVLVALGALEHGFMMLPVPVVDLWRWSVRGSPAAAVSGPALAVRPVLAVVSPGAGPAERPAAATAAQVARQRLEDRFRQAYRGRQAAEAGQMAPEVAPARAE